jgi:uncharacterized membrane protein YhhN
MTELALRRARVRRRRPPSGRRVLAVAWIAAWISLATHTAVRLLAGHLSELFPGAMLVGTGVVIQMLVRYWRAVEGTAYDWPVSALEWALVAMVWAVCVWEWVT